MFLGWNLLRNFCRPTASKYLVCRGVLEQERQLSLLSVVTGRRVDCVKQRFNNHYSTTASMTESGGKKFRLALVQLAVGSDKSANLKNATKLIEDAAKAGAKVVGLPECFNSPYGLQYFSEYAEEIPNGTTCQLISSLAKQLKIYIIAGSIPERGEDSKLYNTCTVYDPAGKLLGKHRKVHLFVIDVPGKITFQESKVLSPGNSLTIVNTEFCKIGIGICYDMRFPEMAQIYRQKGCDLLVYPGAFNMTTGPAHWQILNQARAVDNQVYIATIAPARDETASYIAWGHSMVVNPWGKIAVEAEESETVIYADIDLDYLQEVRKQIPVSIQKRPDLYEVKSQQNLD